MLKPVIKWSGSKRLQAKEILAVVPEYVTYYEPFLGGGSVLYEVHPSRAVCSDICEPLIDLWCVIRDDPETLAKSYHDSWSRLQTEGYTVYYEIRDRFNRIHSPEDLLFLSRTCVNGLIRFNALGKFNNSFHYSRPGIKPESLTSIIRDWSAAIQGVNFLNVDYREATKTATSDDFIYLDPPYMNTVGRYYGLTTIDFDDFFAYLDGLNKRHIRWALSFDGQTSERDYSHSLPPELYRRQLLLDAGQSTFRRVMSKAVNTVQESLFLSF